jgi:ADP-glucose pyrophosphorylase
MEYKAGAAYLMAENVVLGANSKVRRSVILPGCKIGKNVELFNCVLMENVEIKDNCRVHESVLGAGTVVGENAQVKGTYSESGCRVADSLKVDGETLIRTE